MTRAAVATGLAWVTLAACGPRQVEQPGATRDAGPDESTEIRFRIEVDDRETQFFVVPFDESAQPGWVTAYRDGERLYFRERCEIEECGLPPAVCGAALPTVLDLAAAASGSIETVWDGTTSVIDAVARCERREAVGPGDYVARFCYAFNAESEGDLDPRVGPVPGRLIDRYCTDVPFELGDSLVVLSM